MTRALVLLPLLLAACAHQQRAALPEFESVTESAPSAEGGGGFLPTLPYYVAHETMAQAMPPVGSPSWVGQAFSMTLSAPQGAAGAECLVSGGAGTSGVCLGGYPGAQGSLYLGITPSTRTGSNYVVRADGSSVIINSPGTGGLTLRRGDGLGWHWNGTQFHPETNGTYDLGASAQYVRHGYFAGTLNLSAGADVNAIGLSTNGARLDLGGGANDFLYSDGANIITPAQITASTLVSGASLYSQGTLYVDNNAHFRAAVLNDTAGVAPVNVSDPDGFRLSSTAALPTCAAALEGVMKRDGTTGAASTARTRVCLCTSDGAATPAYQWINAVSGTVGTATTCAP